MHRWLIGILSIAACYAPSAPPNAPCSPLGECPENQTCTAGVCMSSLRGGGADIDAAGPGDGGSATDRDGDGIPDVVDNCPDVRNPDQGNEDGDRFGDACDPCPPVADNAPLDSDGDGVADACDPNPQTPGDHIELFEGFHHGLPSWARSSNWTVVGDAVRGTAAANVSEYLVPPTTNPDLVTVSASVVVESTVANNDDGFDVAVPNNVNADRGIDCELFAPATGTTRLAIYDDFQNGEIGRQTLMWSNNLAYTVAMTHRGQSYSCTATDPAKTPHTVTATSASSAGTQPVPTIRAYGVTARVNWVMVVRSP